jgi:dolichyl-phosphate beta-glucosyltransferase
MSGEAMTARVEPGLPRLAVVLPAWNEADRIEQTIETIASYRRSKGVHWPVLLADDGSADATIDRAREAAAAAGLEIRVISFPHRGKASTVRDAMLSLAGDRTLDYLMMLDADDELKISQLDAVDWQPDPLTIYIGRRVGTGGPGGIRPGPLRRVMSAGMRLASRTLLGLSFPDTQCGFKLFPRPIVASLFDQQRATSWIFDAELLVIGHRVSGLPVQEVPVVWSPRGVSRVAPWAAVSSVVGIFGVAWRLWTRTYRPVVADTAGAGAMGRVRA